MTSKSCESIGELLTAYSDGELTAADARRVADHVAECPDCRAELQLLGRSLELAQEVWRQSAARAPLPRSCPARSPRRRLRAAACVAACLVALVLTTGLWLLCRDDAQREVGPIAEIERMNPPLDDFDIEAFIAREGRAARLAAAVQLLATQPELEPYRARAQRYLESTYAGTAPVNGVSTPIIPPPEDPKS